jgi:TolB-like protein/tetratricopeptide (TPR) repeat protein
VTEPSHAVFLSYASQDAQAAQKIAEALRASGIEVWYDQSELRGGDVWDQTIRRQIKACALFIPVISRHTHERKEGYFRLEWKLAVDRSNLISATQAFLVPVVIDDNRNDDEEIPEKIRDIHWTRLPAGETSPAFVDRVKRLLSGEASTPAWPTSTQSGVLGTGTPVAAAWSPRRGLLVAVAVTVLGAAAYIAIEKPWISKPAVSSPTVAASTAPTAFNPPPHSLAVLPFVNMSGDPKQEYFSDGLSEEILNALARIDQLHVAARTSAFSFKGKETDVGTIARKLNVGAILEGSVRRSANTLRITTQLIDASSGYHLWSETYDRNLGDVLKLETDIATAVAGALKVTLLESQADKIEVGGTLNPLALNAYLRGRKILTSAHAPADVERGFAELDEAVRLDPQYARAVAGRSFAWSFRAEFATSPQQAQESLAKAEADARRAIALAPELSDGHGALGVYFTRSLQRARAAEENARAMQLDPGNAYVLAAAGESAVQSGRTDTGLAALRRAATLDPLNARIQLQLAFELYLARRYEEAIAAFNAGLTLDPAYPGAVSMRSLTYYSMGNLEAARRGCELESDDLLIHECRALVYARLGRRADARAALEAMQGKFGDAAAYQYAEIHGQWGDMPMALTWLEKALQLKDSGLSWIKMDPLMDPLRGEPRFQAVLRELKVSD